MNQFRFSVLLRDLALLTLHLVLFVAASGLLLDQWRFLDGRVLGTGRSAFETVFWPPFAWGTLIAAQAGATVFQTRRVMGAVLGATASIMLGAWLLVYVLGGPLLPLAIPLGAVVLSVVTVAVSLVRRPPVLVGGRSSGAAAPLHQPPSDEPFRRRPLGLALSDLVLGLIALVFVLGTVGAGAYRALEVRGSGGAGVRQVEVASIGHLAVAGTGTLVIQQGDRPAVTISGDRNLIGLVDVSVSGDQLELRFDPGARGPASLQNPLVYEVTVPSLERLSLEGQIQATISLPVSFGSLAVDVRDDASLMTTDLSVDELSIAARDGASVRLAGTARTMRIDAGNTVTIDATDIAVGGSTVTAWDRASVVLGQTSTLTYRQSGSARISCGEFPRILLGSASSVPVCVASNPDAGSRPSI